jgi:hypothetical protein
MKKMAVVLIILVCVSTVVSCNLFPQVAVLTIRNNSGAEVKNITFTYERARPDRTETITISSLPDNQSTVRELELAGSSPGIGAGSVAVFGEIEYYINGTKFTTKNGDKEIGLYGEIKTVITILADGWKATRE